MLASCLMRRALPEDLDELEKLEAELFPDNCMNARSLSIEIEHGVCFVERGEQGLAGYLLARVGETGNLVDIMRVGVRDPYRRMGLASRMLTMALKLAPTAMLMVHKGNASAIRLYRSFDFTIAAEYGESWVMLRASDR